VYDVFAGKELSWRQGENTLDVDLGELQGRVLLLTEGPLAAPTVAIASRKDDDPLATLVVRSPIPVPVRIRVGGQEVYRAATSSGSCDTFALAFGLHPGTIPVEVTELVTGQTQRAELTLQKPPSVRVRALPPVQIRDAERLRQVLQAKNLAIYVDPRQSANLPAAQRFAKQLGNNAEVVFNPPVREYAVTWDPSAEQEKKNQQMLSERVLGWRRMIEPYGQWTGALKPAAVWNRPVLLFGNAINNRLLADLDAVTLLARPAVPELVGPGRAFVQPVAAPLWNGQDAAIILCADADGLEKAFAQMLTLNSGKAGESFALDEDGGARLEQRQLLGLETQAYPKHVTALATKSVEKIRVGLEPNLPVSSVVPVKGGVLATLHSPGRNLVRLDNEGKILWRTASGGFYQPTDMHGNAAGEAIVSDDTFVWRHGADGKLLWKALANPAAPPGADGSVWILTDEGRILVGSAGQILARVESKDDILAASPDGRTIYVHRPGDAKGGRTRADAALVAMRDGKVLWSVPNLFAAEVRVSRDGRVLACIEHECMAGRDDLDWLEGSRLTALDARTGKILMRQPLGESLTDLHISADGKHLAVLGHAPSPGVRFMPLTTWNGRTWATRTNRFTRIVYLADTASGVVRRTLLPERGVWASTFSEDGKTFWAASRSLVGIDADTLAIKSGATERFLCLATRPEGGFLAGTAEGTVVWLDSTGKAERQVKILADLASPDPRMMFATLREAKLVNPGPVEPNSVPAEIALVHEADTYLNMRGDVAAPRGDGIVPIRVALRIPEKGRYRFALTLVNPKEETEKIGLFNFAPDNGMQVRTKAETKDRLVQTVDIEMPAGTTLITLLPHDWKTTPLMRTLTVRKVSE
jgi:outer membrane protein assembly factor BamB